MLECVRTVHVMRTSWSRPEDVPSHGVSCVQEGSRKTGVQNCKGMSIASTGKFNVFHMMSVIGRQVHVSTEVRECVMLRHVLHCDVSGACGP